MKRRAGRIIVAGVLTLSTVIPSLQTIPAHGTQTRCVAIKPTRATCYMYDYSPAQIKWNITPGIRWQITNTDGAFIAGSAIGSPSNGSTVVYTDAFYVVLDLLNGPAGVGVLTQNW